MTGQSSSASPRESGSAGWLLGLVYVCLTAGIVAAGYFYYRNYERNYRSEVERQLSAIADLKVGELVQWRKERLSRATRAELRRTMVDLTALAGEIVAELERAEPTRTVRWVIAPGLTANRARRSASATNAWSASTRPPSVANCA